MLNDGLLGANISLKGMHMDICRVAEYGAFAVGAASDISRQSYADDCDQVTSNILRVLRIWRANGVHIYP